MDSLDYLFRPRSVAVIGASRKRGSIGAEIFHNLLFHHFQGVVYPVHPTAESIQAVRAYASVRDIPDSVDLAMIVVPKEHVVTVARECAEKRVRAIVVISAGFKEVGSEGAARETELLRICRDAGIRLVGPNCLGVLNTAPDIRLDATFAPTFPPSGSVAFSSQSGALGLTILDYAKDLGIGVSTFVSIGNKADVSGNDLLTYWDNDPHTKVILFYLESFGNPRKFLTIARDVSRRKPIVAVKSGRSATGAKAAASHTGSLAGSDAAVGALFKQTGVIRVDTVEELFDTAMFLANQPLPKGNRVAILTNAGGPGIMAADACETWGLIIPELKSETQSALRNILAPEATVRNPVDMIASASVETFRQAIPVVLEDPSIDALLVIYVPPIVTKPREIAEAIVEGASGSDKPVLSCFMGTHGVPEGLQSLKKGHIPSYAFPEAAVATVARASAYHEWRRRPQGMVVSFDDFDLAAIQELTSQEGWLSMEKSVSLLKAASIPTIRTGFATTPEKAAEMANDIGFPLALKIDSIQALHKSDVGGVALGLDSAEEVRQAAQAMKGRVGDIRSFALQPMISESLEVIIGATQDPRMGPIVMFGLGGVQVEVLNDVTFRVYPFTSVDAEEMVREIRGAKLLDAYRGKPDRDTNALQEIVSRVGFLLSRFPALQEIDLNPVAVHERGRGAWALDARIRVGRPVT